MLTEAYTIPCSQPGSNLEVNWSMFLLLPLCVGRTGREAVLLAEMLLSYLCKGGRPRNPKCVFGPQEFALGFKATLVDTKMFVPQVPRCGFKAQPHTDDCTLPGNSGFSNRF